MEQLPQNEDVVLPTEAAITLPHRLYLFGGGRHHSTKALRRAARFKRRVFDIGEITIRPNRRVDVNVEFVVKHYDSIVAAMKTGQLLVQHSADEFVDLDELAAMRALFLGEALPGPVVKEVAEDEPDDDPVDNPEGESDDDPALTAPPAPPADPEPTPETDEPNPAALAFGDDEPAAQEPVEATDAPEAVEEPEEAAEPVLEAAADMDEPVVEPEAPVDLAEEPVSEDWYGELAEPEAAPEPEPDAAVEPEAERRFLPEGWEKSTKKDLLKLCAERGISVEGKRTNNETLIDLLKSWQQGA